MSGSKIEVSLRFALIAALVFGASLGINCALLLYHWPYR